MFIKVIKKEKTMIATSETGEDYSSKISYLTKRKALTKNRWIREVAGKKDATTTRYVVSNISLDVANPSL